MGKSWSPEEERSLLLGIGSFGWHWFQTRTQAPHDWPNAPQTRSKGAIRKKAARMGAGGITRGSYALHEAARRTGYMRQQLVRAMRALGQKWKRTSATGFYLISDEQLEELCNWLQHDYWCKPKRLYCCHWCGTQEAPHRTLGLCSRCYFRYRRVCSSLGLPVQTSRMRRLVQSLDLSTRDEASYCAKVIQSLERRVALNREQLDWVVMLRAGAEE